jgi:branched-chain amino acid aminotransferase
MEAEKLDWKNLPFGYLKTDYNIRTYYKNGAWGKGHEGLPRKR